MTRITVITSVLNGMPHLPAALQSLDTGSVPEHAIEHIVVDAGSTDGSLELLRPRRSAKLLLRPGIGLYEAWSLALSEASGDIVIFLNADDVLTPAALQAIIDGAARNPDADVLYGEAEAFQTGPAGEEQVPFGYRGSRLAGPDVTTLLFGAAVINAKAFRRSLFDRIGRFHSAYAFAGDREFLLRLAIEHPEARWQPLDALVYRYRIHSGSQTLAASPQTRLQMAEEQRKIARGFLETASASPAVAGQLKALISRETAVTCVGLARQGRLVSAARVLLETAIKDPFFPFRLPAAQSAVNAFDHAARLSVPPSRPAPDRQSCSASASISTTR